MMQRNVKWILNVTSIYFSFGRQLLFLPNCISVFEGSASSLFLKPSAEMGSILKTQFARNIA